MYDDLTGNIGSTDNFIENSQSDVIIKVIGVGGGGDNAVNHMYEQNINKVSFVVCNTDAQALRNSPVPNKVLIGPNVTKGLGAGNNPDVARQAAEESAEKIADLFKDETRMVFITAGMGGGTGTGAAPVVARIAQECGMLTIGIVTIPFLFEGEKKIFKALEGAEEMSKYVDALLIVNNEQLTEIYSDLNWLNAFGKADDTLSNAARSISELITSDGYMNLDFMDVKRTLENGGAAIISTGYGEGEHRVTRAIEDALNSPLLRNRDIYGSKRLLFNLYFSRNAEQEFKMGEANELSTFIANIDKGVDVIYGIGFDESLGNKIKITILAAGFELSIKDEIKKPKDHLNPISPFGPSKQPEQTEKENILAGYYGNEKIEATARARDAKHYIVLKPEQFDDDSVIELFEKNQTYNRDHKTTNEVRNASSAASQAADSPKAETTRPAESDSAAPTPLSDGTPGGANTTEIVF